MARTRRRRGDPARRDGRARSGRSGDAGERRPVHPGLPGVPQARRIAGRAHRRAAGPGASTSRRSSDPILEGVVEALKREGAELVDPVEFPTLGQADDAEYEVLLYEFKADLEAYFACEAGRRGPHAGRPHRVEREERRPGDALLRAGDPGAGGEEGAADREGLCRGAGEVPRADAGEGHRRRDGRTQARRARRPDQRPGPHDRPRQRRFVLGEQLVARGRGRVSDDHPARGLGPRPARGHLAHRPGLERAGAHQAGVRTGAGPRGAQAAAPATDGFVRGRTKTTIRK
ncbi:MAG: hypothetical protein MZU84_08210 [Sphingobacterium sp.]|nr:hypothetical protein [Sphingobacterium sp.]